MSRATSEWRQVLGRRQRGGTTHIVSPHGLQQVPSLRRMPRPPDPQATKKQSLARGAVPPVPPVSSGSAAASPENASPQSAVGGDRGPPARISIPQQAPQKFAAPRFADPSLFERSMISPNSARFMSGRAQSQWLRPEQSAKMAAGRAGRRR